MRKPLKYSLIAALSGTLALFAGAPASAATPGQILPQWVLDFFRIPGPAGVCTVQYITSRVRLALFLVMGGLVLVSIVYIVMAAFKYITSKGESGRIEEATKTIKSVFMGIAVLVVGIVGIILVFVLMGGRPVAPALYQTCFNHAESAGCKACQSNMDDPLCVSCEAKYNEICNTSNADALTMQQDEVDAMFTIDPELTRCVTP